MPTVLHSNSFVEYPNNYLNPHYDTCYCFPSLDTPDLYSQCRRHNSYILSKTSCYAYSLKWGFETDPSYSEHDVYALHSVFSEHLYPLLKNMFYVWWIAHVHTCEDVKLLYFLFGQQDKFNPVNDLEI